MRDHGITKHQNIIKKLTALCLSKISVLLIINDKMTFTVKLKVMHIKLYNNIIYLLIFFLAW